MKVQLFLSHVVSRRGFFTCVMFSHEWYLMFPHVVATWCVCPEVVHWEFVVSSSGCLMFSEKLFLKLLLRGVFWR